MIPQNLLTRSRGALIAVAGLLLALVGTLLPASPASASEPTKTETLCKSKVMLSSEDTPTSFCLTVAFKRQDDGTGMRFLQARFYYNGGPTTGNWGTSIERFDQIEMHVMNNSGVDHFWTDNGTSVGGGDGDLAWLYVGGTGATYKWGANCAHVAFSTRFVINNDSDVNMNYGFMFCL